MAIVYMQSAPPTEQLLSPPELMRSSIQSFPSRPMHPADPAVRRDTRSSSGRPTAAAAAGIMARSRSGKLLAFTKQGADKFVDIHTDMRSGSHGERRAVVVKSFLLIVGLRLH